MTEKVDEQRGIYSTEAEFDDLVVEFRRMHAALCASLPDPALTSALRQEFSDAADRLELMRAPMETIRASHRGGLSSRSHPTLLPFHVDHIDDHMITATVEFSEVHVGGNEAVHGGTIPLLFDDLLGKFVEAKAQDNSRTAFLKVNYRRITPIDTPLRVEGTIDRIEGRKTWVSGRLYRGSEVTAEAEALFLRLLPGQQ